MFILIVFSLTIEVYATISYNDCFLCRTDTNQLERDGSDTSANDCEDESLTPDLWEKMSCGDGLHEDSDGLDVVDCNNGLELADCYRESLLGELNFNEEIPDMECFKNTPAASSEDQEPLRDEQALYQDSPLSVAESSLLLMAFSVRHKLSGVALEDLLELIQLHCPKPNKCITELKEFQLFFQALKHPVVKHYYCPNLICKLYVGTSKPENTSKCAVCGTPLTSSFYFIEIPIVEQLRTILSGKLDQYEVGNFFVSLRASGFIYLSHSHQQTCIFSFN